MGVEAALGGAESLVTGVWSIAVLGSFRLWSDRSQVSLSAGSQRLLALLALHPGTMARCVVAGTLWPESSEDHAFSSLRSVVARLPMPCREAVAVGPRELGLREEVTVDLIDVRAMAARLLDPHAVCLPSDLGLAAVSVLSAELLPGWYDDWLVIEAEDWRQLRIHALEAMAGRLVDAGRLGEAAVAARAAVGVEPLRETARSALIKVYLAEGNQSEAVLEFARYSALLRAELGLEPTPALRRLVPAAGM